MSWEEFEDMLTQTAQLYKKDGIDTHGKPTHTTTPINVPCRIIGKSNRVFTVDEKTISSNYKMIAGYTDPISSEDKIVLPAGYEPSTPAILGVYPVDDDEERHHYEIWFA